MEIEDDMISNEQSDTPSLSDLIRDCQYQTNNFHFSQLLDEFVPEWSSNTDTISENINTIKMEQTKEEEEEQYEEDSNDSLSYVQEHPPVSLFRETKQRPRPWQRNRVIGKYLEYILFT